MLIIFVFFSSFFGRFVENINMKSEKEVWGWELTLEWLTFGSHSLFKKIGTPFLLISGVHCLIYWLFSSIKKYFDLDIRFNCFCASSNMLYSFAQKIMLVYSNIWYNCLIFIDPQWRKREMSRAIVNWETAREILFVENKNIGIEKNIREEEIGMKKKR